jgi:peptidoglycan hydrolase-like protein with peptidoglycan-binding domain
MDAAWPFVGYQGPQPWEAVNPPMLTQNHLMLSAGMSGEEVVELAGLLAYLGYGTSISAGQNPHAIYDTGVSAAVRAFCQDYGVEEDPKVRAARTDDTVGPWLWEALVRAVHKKVNAERQ